MIREKIEKILKESIFQLQREKVFPIFKTPEFKVEFQERDSFGDLSTNLAIVLSRIIKKDPMEIGEIVREKILTFQKTIFEKIEIREPGFINFFISKKFLTKLIVKIIQNREKFFQQKLKKRKKVQVEFISANPTGPLHIGNGRGAFFGDCLANVLEKTGFKVQREYFINDAKSNSQIQALGRTILGKDNAYLTEYLKEKIEKLKPRIKKIASEKEAGYLMAKEIIKDIKNFVEKKLKIKFDNWVSEEKFFREGKIDKVYKFLEKKGLVYEKEGAKWLRISKFGAEKDEVIVRRTGEPTYFLSDIAYHKDKFNRGFQKIINIWGADHQGHVPKIKAAAKILGFKGKLEILISQIVTLKGGEKLSKRKGKIITLEELINEVGLDVARFFYLTKSLDSPMEFDLNLAKEKSQKNPVFYIQYAFARICSIFRKGKIKEEEIKVSKNRLDLFSHPAEINLIKNLIRFPTIVEDCSKDYQLQKIPYYALELARSFHFFYDSCRVLGEKEEVKNARLGLVLATKIILKETLSLMGISAPKRM